MSNLDVLSTGTGAGKSILIICLHRRKAICYKEYSGLRFIKGVSVRKLLILLINRDYGETDFHDGIVEGDVECHRRG